MPARTRWAGGKWTDRVLWGLRLFQTAHRAEDGKPASRRKGAPGRYRRLKAAGKESRLLKNQEHAYKDSRTPGPVLAAGRFPIRRAAH